MKKIFYNNIIISGFLLVVLFAGAALTYAAGEGIQYNLLAPFGEAQQVSTFGDYLSGAIPFLVQLAAVLATVFIVIGGFEYAMSDSITSKQDARDMITQAVIGLLIALTSYLILNTLSPDLVRLDIPSLKNISELVTIPNESGTNNLPDINSNVSSNNMVICAFGPSGTCRTDWDAVTCSQARNGIMFNPSRQVPCPEGAPPTLFLNPINNVQSPFTCSSYTPTNRYNCASTGPGVYWSMQRCAPGCSGDTDYFETVPFTTEADCRAAIERAIQGGVPSGTLFRCVQTIRQ